MILPIKTVSLSPVLPAVPCELSRDAAEPNRIDRRNRSETVRPFGFVERRLARPPSVRMRLPESKLQPVFHSHNLRIDSDFPEGLVGRFAVETRSVFARNPPITELLVVGDCP